MYTKFTPTNQTGKQIRAAALAVAACMLALLCAGCQNRTSTPPAATVFTATATPAETDPVISNSLQTTETSNLPEKASLEFILSGESIHTIPIEDDAKKKILMDAIFNHLIKSAAWPGDDPDTIKNRITIRVQFSKDEGYPTEYHVFERDGHYCMQAGRGFYSMISDEVYWPLHDLAMGYGLPQALTIRSGKNEIKATALPVASGQEGKRFLPLDMAEHIQYLELDPANNRDSLTPFTPYAGGNKVFGFYRLYNQKFAELDFINPSGLEPQTYLFSGKEPGRYIVELETTLGEDEGLFQYFFGVVVPEGYGSK